MSERISHHDKECYVPRSSATHPHHVGQCRGADGKTRERRVAKAEERTYAEFKWTDDWNCPVWRIDMKEENPDRRQRQRRGASQGEVCGQCGGSIASGYELVNLGGKVSRVCFACIDAPDARPSVESAAPKTGDPELDRDLATLHDMRHPESEAVSKLVEALHNLSIAAIAAKLYLPEKSSVLDDLAMEIAAAAQALSDHDHSLARDAKGEV